MENKQDVHSFDCKLINIFTPTKVYSDDEKIKIISSFISSSIITNPNSIDMLNLIINDKSSNFQKENNLDCTDILIDIILHKNFKDSLSIFEEQLADIKLGTCPSGRTTRLRQYWVSLRNV